MKLLVDDREPKNIQEKLKEYFEVEVIRLEVGDYFSSGICVERKTWEDFIGSIIDNRIWDQAKEMKEYTHPILLITGNRYKALSKRKIKYDSGTFLWRAVGTLAIKYGIRVITCEDEDDFIKAVEGLYAQIDKPTSERPTKHHKKNRTKREVEVDILCCIKKIGNKKASLILDKFGCVRNLYIEEPHIIKKKLLEIDGIGNKLVENIMEVIK